jgi:hypothetical protein
VAAAGGRTLRLILNALTTPHVFLGGRVDQ